MASRYIVSSATIAGLRALLQRVTNDAAIGFNETDQTVRIIDPATGDELTLGTFNGAVTALVLAQGKIVVGDAGGAGAEVDMSGDASIDDAGAVTVTGINGAPVTGDGADVQALLDDSAGILAASTAIAALPVANVAAPAIWNDAGVLKVGTL